MKPVDMKLPKNKSAESAAPTAVGNDYPWGLSLHLDKDSLKKLGITKLPEVGAECMLMGTGKVTSISKSATERDVNESVSIQITKLAIEHEDMEEAFNRGFKRGPKRRGY